MAVTVERQFGRDREIACLIVAEERLAALAGPLDRATDLARRPSHQREFRIERTARSEIAADLVHDDPHLVLRNAEDFGELLLRPDGAANPGIEGVAPGLRVKGAGGGARLHRDTGDALHPSLEFDDVSRIGKRRIGGG